jgi:PKHD-type hydroxylase
MLLQIPDVLNAEQLASAREALESAGDAWVDGRVTAGHQGTQVKLNLQLDERSAVARALGAMIAGCLERLPLFISAALPARVYPPMFNRYDAASRMHFGNHVDGAVRLLPGTDVKLRTDLSATLFISSPDEYDGGELLIEESSGARREKLEAGAMVLYPASTVHQVTPVTRGMRLASFFWIQSMVRDDAQRALLFDLDMAVMGLTRDAAGHPALVSLTGAYHNLLRMWAEV